MVNVPNSLRETILQLSLRGLEQSAIVHRLGLSRNVVSGHLYRLRGQGKIAAATKTRRRPWTEAETTRLAALRAQGKEWSEIAVIMKRGVTVCSKQGRKMGLPAMVGLNQRQPNAPFPADRARKASVQQAGTKSELYAMLRQAVLNTGGRE